MSRLEVPRLFKNRCGVWCFRLRSGKADSRVSLRTKCELAAHMIAWRLNAAVEAAKGDAMTSRNPKLSELGIDLAAVRRYEIDVKNGVYKAHGREDHELMMDAIERIGMIPDGVPKPLRPSAAAPPPAAPGAASEASHAAPGLSLDAVAKMWLAERGKKNAPRTVYAKSRHFEDLAKHVDRSKPINSVGKATMVAYKNALLKAGQEAKTTDNKLMSAHDLFSYAISNALYAATAANPVSGLFILNKAERKEHTESYEPFTDDDLKKFFEPEAYKVGMGTEPDFYWCPLIGLYTGMRISEAAAIRCDDVRKAPNGVDYLFVPKSKTSAGVRNVPLHDALLGLGFLDFVAAQRAAGHERLFPGRLLINSTYSKELSKQMKHWLVTRGIKRKDDHKSFHSFRVNVITQLANKGANTVQVMKIVGHKAAGMDDVHLGYVRDLPDLKEVVDRLQWPMDLSNLLMKAV